MILEAELVGLHDSRLCLTLNQRQQGLAGAAGAAGRGPPTCLGGLGAQPPAEPALTPLAAQASGPKLTSLCSSRRTGGCTTAGKTGRRSNVF